MLKSKAIDMPKFSIDGALTINDCGEIVYVNSNIEQVLGYNNDELLGMHINELFSGSLFQLLPSTKKRLKAMSKSGKLIDISLLITDTFRSNETSYYTAFIFDLTKQTERIEKDTLSLFEKLERIEKSVIESTESTV